MKKVLALISLFVVAAFLAGCGETVNGAIKDTKRIGSGIKKVFVRDSS
jgi:predicted small secreted protein